MKNIFIIAFGLVLFVSCQEKIVSKKVENKAIKKEQLAEVNPKKVLLRIEGMTCEIGCARTIQSKLSKTEGIQSAKVSFEEKEGVVEYDANLITQKQIVAVVEQIAGGDLYKIAEIKLVE